MNHIWQPQLCVYYKFVSEVCVAGDMQFKRASLDQVPVQDDAHAAIVSWRHNAYQQNAMFNRHAAASSDTAVVPKGPGVRQTLVVAIFSLAKRGSAYGQATLQKLFEEGHYLC
jgi:hypothetical protein